MDSPDVQTAETTDDREPAQRSGDQPGAAAASTDAVAQKSKPREIGGPQGPEPTRFGDWERAGRCIDF
ncbi:MAG: DUF1674 domain-containing protein [Gammaproteobacteria bacterium]|nr:DUF1674 domain-containing protein [Gammaproteobacteria bacterium]